MHGVLKCDTRQNKRRSKKTSRFVTQVNILKLDEVVCIVRYNADLFCTLFIALLVALKKLQNLVD